MTDATETTNEIQTNLSNPDKPWLFKKGQSGNPLGRPKGSKLLSCKCDEISLA